MLYEGAGRLEHAQGLILACWDDRYLESEVSLPLVYIHTTARVLVHMDAAGGSAPITP